MYNLIGSNGGTVRMCIYYTDIACKWEQTEVYYLLSISISLQKGSNRSVNSGCSLEVKYKEF